jgi:hypothetical protein
LWKDGAAQGPVVATYTCACMAGTGGTRDAARLLRPCSTISKPTAARREAVEVQEGRQAGRRQGEWNRSWVRRGARSSSLRLAASKSSSINLISRHHHAEMPARWWRKNVVPACEKARLLLLLLPRCSSLTDFARSTCPSGRVEPQRYDCQQCADTRR